MIGLYSEAELVRTLYLQSLAFPLVWALAFPLTDASVIVEGDRATVVNDLRAEIQPWSARSRPPGSRWACTPGTRTRRDPRVSGVRERTWGLGCIGGFEGRCGAEGRLTVVELQLPPALGPCRRRPDGFDVDEVDL
jgi:hypothetical protein